MKNKKQVKLDKISGPLKIDLGAGNNPKEGFVGVDSIKFDKTDIVADLTKKWPFEDNSVDEAHASHFIEHLTNLDGKLERVHFFNELYRVLKPGSKATLIFPHWASTRYYGDPSHKEPFSEFGFYYLSKEWRLGNAEKGLGANAPHTDASFVKGMYNCDFEANWGYNLHPEVMPRNQEYQIFAMTFYKEACQDIIAVLTKK